MTPEEWEIREAKQREAGKARKAGNIRRALELLDECPGDLKERKYIEFLWAAFNGEHEKKQRFISEYEAMPLTENERLYELMRIALEENRMDNLFAIAKMVDMSPNDRLMWAANEAFHRGEYAEQHRLTQQIPIDPSFAIFIVELSGKDNFLAMGYNTSLCDAELSDGWMEKHDRRLNIYWD